MVTYSPESPQLPGGSNLRSLPSRHVEIATVHVGKWRGLLIHLLGTEAETDEPVVSVASPCAESAAPVVVKPLEEEDGLELAIAVPQVPT